MESEGLDPPASERAQATPQPSPPAEQSATATSAQAPEPVQDPSQSQQTESQVQESADAPMAQLPSAPSQPLRSLSSVPSMSAPPPPGPSGPPPHLGPPSGVPQQMPPPPLPQLFGPPGAPGPTQFAQMPYPMPQPLPQTANPSPPVAPMITTRYREGAGPVDHQPHPDCPDTLACLPDTDGRPQHTLPVILRCAILGSPQKRLTIRGIYAAMEEKYVYFQTAGQTWKQSVRHHLSLNRLFERVPRAPNDPGFGSYWTVNLAAPPGTKRPRKRGKPGAAKAKGKSAETELDTEMGGSADGTAKNGDSADADGDGDGDAIGEKDEEHPGDPDFESEEDTRKDVKEDAVDDKKTNGGPARRTRTRTRQSARQPYPNGTKAAAAVSAPPAPSTTEGGEPVDGTVVDRLQIELAALRRQSAETITRLSEQLTQAQADATRTRDALTSTQAALEEESRKRKDAERVVEGLRRAGLLQGFQPVNTPLNLGPLPPPHSLPHMQGAPMPMPPMPGPPMSGPPPQGPPRFQ
ncbi:hypothetical protein GGF50DRAFT_122110 [Schizophyllum commune]